MNIIKNIRYLEGLISPDQLEKLNHGADLFKRHGRIYFKVLETNEKHITVQTIQTKSLAENYLDKKGLVTRTKELFAKFFPDRDIRVRPVEYLPPSVDQVTPNWLQRKLEEKGINQHTIVEMTGIDKGNVSSWISGAKPMSQPVKAMFYFMLKD
ncbi:hypothetical protein GCM10028791_37150 [Echinicola sediminis]